MQFDFKLKFLRDLAAETKKKKKKSKIVMIVLKKKRFETHQLTQKNLKM